MPGMEALQTFWSWAGLALLLLTAVAWWVAGRWRTRMRAALADNSRLAQDLGHALALAEQLRERLDETRDAMHARELQGQRDLQALRELEQRHVELQTRFEAGQDYIQALQAGLNAARDQMKLEFQNLADRVLDEKSQRFASLGQGSMEALLRPFREQIAAFQTRVNSIHDETLRANVALHTEIRQVADLGLQIGQEARSLAGALRGDKKTVGNWGEVQLERTLQLAGLVAGDHYRTQPHYVDRNGQRRQPDLIVDLPDKRHLVIDSKVSLVDYDRALAADTDAGREAALDAHVRAVRQHVEDLAHKEYSALPGLDSPAFVFMYMPVEAAYIAALRHDSALYDDAYRRNVILVSHTTLLPVLRMVANVWMRVRSDEQAHELGAHAAEIYNQVAVVAQRLKRLGGTLATVSRHYNDTVTAVAGQQGLYGKITRFADVSARINRSLPDLDVQHLDFIDGRLDEPAGDETEHLSGAQENE